MRVFQRKQRPQLTALPPSQADPNASEFELSSGAISNSFHGWLHTVAPSTSLPKRGTVQKFHRSPKLTALDVLRVNHATIREGESHCIWPPSVVRQFKSAKVITDKRVEHYELRDTNLRKVG